MPGRDERMIQIAAEREELEISEFMLRAARDKAELSLADRNRFTANRPQWKLFIEALERPAREKPRLRELFRESHVAKRRR